ncbi:MAG: SpoIIE family protein phosphatase [Cytophagales bacterium]|nr:SpoIIE family protein phosphatase [Cytophagales bacterium]
MNIYTKLTVLCLFLVITSSVALIFFSNRQFSKQFQEEITSGLQERTTIVAQQVINFLEERASEISFAANQNELNTAKLNQLTELHNGYMAFSQMDINQIKVAESSNGIGDIPNGVWEILQSGTDQAISIEKTGTAVALYIASSIPNSGAVVAKMRTSAMFKDLDSDAEALAFYLIDQKGLILYTNDGPERALNESFDNYSQIKDRGTSAIEMIETNDQYLMVKKLNVANTSNWSLVFEVDKSVVLSPIGNIQSSLIIAVVIILVIVALLALVAANIFVKPIIQLSKVAEEIGNGNLKAKVDIQSKDELGKLGEQLNSMSERLDKILNEEKELSNQLGSQASELEDQKNQLEIAHAQITSSLDYAQRIQSSMLPTNSELRRNVMDSFIFFRPKDVVSGDFFWFEKVRRGRSEFLILAAADCTGHGVPGAIMSMMGGNQLTNIIYYQNYIEPEKILARLDKAIKFELYRDEQVTQRRDGMEIMVCVIDLDSLEMKFAGAGMPLLRLPKEGEMEVHKSPRLMIGGVEGDDEKEVEEQFKLETMQLDEGDKIFLASDGFQDQFGGPDDKRYMARNMRRFLEKNRDLKMKEVGGKVEQEFDRWKGEQDQTDDVLLIGVEL